MVKDEMFIECPKCGHEFSVNIDEEIRKKADQEAELKYKDELDRSNKQMEEVVKANEEAVEKARKEVTSKLEIEYIEKQAELIKNAKESGMNEEKLRIDTERSKDKSLIESLVKQVNDLKATANQSSNKRQGDSLEFELIRVLKSLYPLDEISKIKNGQSGADCLQIIRDKTGKEISRILWEAKETKTFNDKTWIPKLKKDQKDVNAVFSVILTKTLPNDISNFGIIDNVFVTDIDSVSGLSYILREFSFILAKKDVSDDGNEEIMTKVYDYILGLKYNESLDSMIRNIDVIDKETVNINKYIVRQMNVIRKYITENKNIVFEIKYDINEILHDDGDF
ncbi:DUF2130 domain-containing protein [Patescibacteria group bacterium]|nr:DUF2130 domain-containing protein [Patescibacteria group bacterium]